MIYDSKCVAPFPHFGATLDESHHAGGVFVLLAALRGAGRVFLAVLSTTNGMVSFKFKQDDEDVLNRTLKQASFNEIHFRTDNDRIWKHMLGTEGDDHAPTIKIFRLCPDDVHIQETESFGLPVAIALDFYRKMRPIPSDIIATGIVSREKDQTLQVKAVGGLEQKLEAWIETLDCANHSSLPEYKLLIANDQPESDDEIRELIREKCDSISDRNFGEVRLKIIRRKLVGEFIQVLESDDALREQLIASNKRIVDLQDQLAKANARSIKLKNRLESDDALREQLIASNKRIVDLQDQLAKANARSIKLKNRLVVIYTSAAISFLVAGSLVVMFYLKNSNLTRTNQEYVNANERYRSAHEERDSFSRCIHDATDAGSLDKLCVVHIPSGSYLFANFGRILDASADGER